MVGVVTKIETESGIVHINDVDADLRREWAEKLEDKIEELDGVDFAAISSLSQFSENQVGSIEVVVETTTEDFSESTQLQINPRSFSPQLRSVCEDYAPLSSFEVSVTPTAVDASRGLYDKNFYIIDLYFY